MIRSIIIAVLAIALVGTGVYANQLHNEKQALAISHENNYQRAFHQLTYHMDQLEDELGGALAMNGMSHLSGSLAEVWRISSLAGAEMGELPLGLVPVDETEEYLTNVAEFTYETAIRDRTEEPLSDDEYEKLETFYQQAGEIKHDLRTVQASALKNDTRWLDVEAELVNAKEPGEGTMVDGIRNIDQKAKGFAENNWDENPGFSLDVDKRLAKAVKDRDPVSKEEAADRARDFLNMPEDTDVEVNDLGEGLPYDGYQILIEDPDGESSFMMDMTKKGGLPIWVMQDRPLGEQNISLNEASEAASQYLDNQGFEDMQLVESNQYDNIAVFQFVPVANDTRIYPDEVLIEIALDDGDLVGYKGAPYLANHHERHDLTPEITLDEALEEVHDNLEVREEHLAVIENQSGEEVLAYELYATMNDDTYRLYINADDGTEEEVKRMPRAEPIYDVR